MHDIFQKLVLSYETLVILTVISGAFAIGLFVHNTTAQINKDLPTEVLEQQQDISYMVQDLSDLARAAEIANLTPSSDHTSRLLVKLDRTLAKLQSVRQTYNFDNLIGASAMHSIVNPALLDIRHWLTVGLPDIPSHSPIIFNLVQQRANETYQQTQDLFVRANASATALIALEKKRLTRFRNSMFLYLSIFALYATGVVILFVRQRNIKARLALEQKRLKDSIESINEGFALFDKNDQLVICNQNFRELFPPVANLITTGVNLGKFRSLADKFSRPSTPIQYQPEGSPQSQSLEKFTEIQTNQGRHLRVSEHPTREGGTVGIYSDITALKRAQEKLKKIAKSDALTGLPNRKFFLEHLTQAIAEGTRYRIQFAVFFFDLDRFKPINDSMGHLAGDELLISASERLQNCLRETDLISRLGGDEFAAIVHHLSGWKDALEFAGRALKVINSPFRIQGAEIFVSTSIGIALFPQDGTDAMDLLKNADVACYHAKSQGRNNFQFFTQEMNRKADERLKLGKQLHEALESAQLNLHYQPQLDLNTGSIVCVEALLRWNRSALNNISTKELIAFAEETGLVLAIDTWMLKQACLQNKRWQNQGLNPVCTSVNLSSRLFREPELLITTVETILAETGMDPEYLAFEIKEAAIMENNDHIQETIKKIRHLGVQIYLDGFGLGCSPLKALQESHLSGLKMDISILNQNAKDTDFKEMVQAIIALAHSLKLIVIAEGVETEEQLDMIRACHCDQAQGYWLSEPAPADAIAPFLKPNFSLPWADNLRTFKHC